MDDTDSRQQVIERLKQASNILVTVSTSPSVDALSAALSLTLMLNKINKHATAVFSGTLPPAIGFLEPNKTFESNVDSLRDFIIALDKNKADHLRYKVEDDVVRIFITPYRTTITQKDLQFSQGDFNVDLIVALGVEKRTDLDKAITAHGRILHDATVITINAGTQKSSLGVIDWQDAGASSLSEMLVGASESLQQGLLDQQISTALLTGIVAATERFSNQRTSPKVMTMAAQLMAAGANQQLIATKLRPLVGGPGDVAAPNSTPPAQPSTFDNPVDDIDLDEGIDLSDDNGPTVGGLMIDHSAPPSPEPKPPKRPRSGPPDPNGALAAAEEALAEALPIAPPAAQQAEDLKQAIAEETQSQQLPKQKQQPKPPKNSQDSQNSQNQPQNQQKPREDTPKPQDKLEPLPSITVKPMPQLRAPANESSTPLPVIGDVTSSWQDRDLDRPMEAPTFGGTLNATAEQALEDAKKRDQDDRNLALLSHDVPAPPAATKPPQPPVADTLADLEQALGERKDALAVEDPAAPNDFSEPLHDIPQPQDPNIAPANEEAARRAVQDAFNVLPPKPEEANQSSLAAMPAVFEPTPGPEPFMPAPESLPSASEPAPLPSAPAPILQPVDNSPASQPAQSFEPNLPPPPPMPDFNALPNLPPPPPIPGTLDTQQMPAPPAELIPPETTLPELPPQPSQDAGLPPSGQQPPADNNLGQFKIPGR